MKSNLTTARADAFDTFGCRRWAVSKAPPPQRSARSPARLSIVTGGIDVQMNNPNKKRKKAKETDKRWQKDRHLLHRQLTIISFLIDLRRSHGRRTQRENYVKRHFGGNVNYIWLV